MILLEIVFLAIVQGIAEFLPISSSGHLVVLAAIFEQCGIHLEEKLTVNIVLHLGSLAAILVFYRRRVWQLLGADRRVVGLLVVATMPAVVVGLALKIYCEDTLKDPMAAGLMFFVTAAMLLWTGRHQSGQTECRDLSYPRALVIGVFQAIAILPGVSRSGSTIVAGLAVGLKRDEAATFAFLLAIPAIAGAGLLEIKDLVAQGTGGLSAAALLLGALISFVVGLATLAWLIRWIQQGQLHRFAWWLLLIGPLVVVWQLATYWG
ncbi:MAG: undecaprenyl-diphosphate phosphatase [Planctomycetia bacterium]|nr:undecaprenyl-diphosphate phosphatase [Planctomycetia bacterium]